MRILLVGILLFLLGGTPPISVKVHPAVIFYNSGSSVAITVTVDPHSDNRVGLLEITGPDYYTSSEFPVQGAEAAKTYRFIRRITDPGNYEVIAKVKRLGGKEFTARVTLVVVSGEAQQDPQSRRQGSLSIDRSS